MQAVNYASHSCSSRFFLPIAVCLFRRHHIAAASGDMDSPSTHGTPSLSNPSDEELLTELNQLPEAAPTGIRAIRKLLQEKHPHWVLSDSRVRQAWNDLKGKKPVKRAAASSDTDDPSLSTSATSAMAGCMFLSSLSLPSVQGALHDWLPHFAKKQVATMMLFTCAPGDIRNHAGEREEKYRDLYDDMAANTQLWMNFLDDRSNYNHAENICGILVRLCTSSLL